MYHALYRGEDSGAIDAEALPYALAEADFVAQLDCLVARGIGHRPGEGEEAGRGVVASPFDGGSASAGAAELPATPPAVLLTFDDGHASDHDIALPHLLERGLHASFFVTSDFVGRRPGFCEAGQVAALAAAGMSVGSHGASHVFLDDLDDRSAARELAVSRERLAAMGAGEVTSLSFPGGRWSPRTLTLARQAGYTRLFDSRVAPESAAALAAGRRGDGTPLARVAVRRGVPLADFRRIVDADPRWFGRHRAVQRVKRAARTVLGNKVYHGLYKSLS